MEATIREYFQRYTKGLSESVVVTKGQEDFMRMRQYIDYLDYDRASIIRKKGALCGLRNIGNTCYLNTILQLLYNITYLRQKVFAAENIQSKFLVQLKNLFARMIVGKLVFADPTEFFQVLRHNHPQTFVSGVQNDFHQIFTLILEQLNESFKEISAEDKRFLEKLFFGKLQTRLQIKNQKHDQSIVKNSRFNIINLEVSHGNFDSAIAAWQHYIIQDYLTEEVFLKDMQGIRATALAQNCFLETPALMTFLINRVSYKNNKLEKDMRVFEFNPSITIEKIQSESKKFSKSMLKREKELTTQKESIKKWSQHIKEQKINLANSLKYLQEKDIQTVEVPTVFFMLFQIDNGLGEAALAGTKLYLQKQIIEIDKQLVQCGKDLQSIEDKLNHLQEDGNFETYFLWGFMIHEGKTPDSGHYKVCITNSEGQWHEYNDRDVYQISEELIQKYKQKGQICCLFYKRTNLICDANRNIISGALKNTVCAYEKVVRNQIDKAMLYQSLYQQVETSMYILDYYMREGAKQMYSLFFKPVIFCLWENLSLYTCRAVILYDLIKNQQTKKNISNKLIGDETQLKIPDLQFGIPAEYFQVKKSLQAFFDKQASFGDLHIAYLELSKRSLKFNRKLLKDQYLSILEIIVLKGLFYLALFAQNCNQTDLQPRFNQLSEALDGLLANFNSSSEFVLIYVPIKYSINDKMQARLLKLKEKKVTVLDPKRLNFSRPPAKIQDYYKYFIDHFRYWIEERMILGRMDEVEFSKNRKLFAAYLIKSNE